MKAYFASLTDLQLRPVDAHVHTVEEGAAILGALAAAHADHSVILRARVRQGADYESQFIGLGRDAAAFVTGLRDGQLPLKA